MYTSLFSFCSVFVYVLSSMQLLKEAQSKLRDVQSSLDYVLKTSRESPRCQQLGQPSSSSSKKVLRFSSPTQAKRCTIYPRTPHPLHNMTCVVDGPQLASTPVKTGSGGPCLQLHYSDSSGSPAKEPATSAATEPGSGRDPASGAKECDVSPIGELTKREVPVIMVQNSTLDQFEDALGEYTTWKIWPVFEFGGQAAHKTCYIP